MGSKKTFYDALLGRFDNTEYRHLKTFYIDNFKIEVIERLGGSPNTPMKAGSSDVYVIKDKDTNIPKQITFYKMFPKEDGKLKFKDIDLEEHNHKTGYVGNPHVHDYDYVNRGLGRPPNKEELAFVQKILRKTGGNDE